MRYSLIFLTMKGREETAARTLASFNRYVTPSPTYSFAHTDGEVTMAWDGWKVDESPAPVGFCESTRVCWDEVSAHDTDWVFWLEDDFQFVRDMDLTLLARVLDVNPNLAQMALYRNPYSSEEHRYGGYLNTPGRSYEPMATDVGSGVTRRTEVAEPGETPWFEHRDYWTTNPSLFRREIASEFAWPGEPRCEGQFGFEIRAGRPGTTFGVWGAGDVYVEHFGLREGSGY